MELNESDDDILPEARVFEFRAQNIFQSKLDAIKELLSKPLEELDKSEEEEVTQTKKQKKPRGRKQKKEKSSDQVEVAKPKRTRKKEKSSDQVEVAKPKRTRKKKIVVEDLECSPPMRNEREGTPILDSDEYSPRRNKRAATPEDDWYASPKKTRVRRKKRASDDEDGGIVDPDDISPVSLPAASKRKIKELKLNTSRLQRQIDMENKQILSAFDDAEVIEDSSEDVGLEHSITLKIRLMSDISKMTVKQKEVFATIYNKVADMHNLQASEILLCVRDQTIKLTDTPLSLNLKYFEIIDCLPYKPTVNILGDVSNNFLLKMQSNDSRKKVDVYGSKLEKFEGFMKRYSEMRNIPLDKLSFEFDGEKIEGSETPEELEIESGSCIDVNVLKENSKAPSVNGDIEITAEIISPSNRMEILELD